MAVKKKKISKKLLSVKAIYFSSAATAKRLRCLLKALIMEINSFLLSILLLMVPKEQSGSKVISNEHQVLSLPTRDISSEYVKPQPIHHGVEGVYSDSNNCEITFRNICFFHMRFQRKMGRNTVRTDAETQELGHG
ncbi:hypothetical protein BD560DRAFT_427179 [Blakeslea trispora]|nr:hypothetical protein BD560DRAFT_427179 [Blakeslea trispora]